MPPQDTAAAAEMVHKEEGNHKRRRFVMPAQREKPRVPRTCELTLGPRKAPVPPPPEVAQKLGCATIAVGVDIETHDWEHRVGNKAVTGQFGAYSLCHPDDLDARIVQIGWAVGASGETPLIKERLVRPEGFRIASKAANYHGISHEKAVAEGGSLQEVLEDFMEDMLQAWQCGGRLVIHHLEFDCGIILRELERVHSTHQAAWRDIAQRGLCTMDPWLGRWVRSCFGEDAGPSSAKNTLRLSELMSKLVPKEDASFGPQHTAGPDAHRHWRLYFELLQLAAVSEA